MKLLDPKTRKFLEDLRDGKTAGYHVGGHGANQTNDYLGPMGKKIRKLSYEAGKIFQDLTLMAEALPEELIAEIFNGKNMEPFFKAIFSIAFLPEIELRKLSANEREIMDVELRERKERVIGLWYAFYNILNRISPPSPPSPLPELTESQRQKLSEKEKEERVRQENDFEKAKMDYEKKLKELQSKPIFYGVISDPAYGSLLVSEDAWRAYMRMFTTRTPDRNMAAILHAIETYNPDIELNLRNELKSLKGRRHKREEAHPPQVEKH